jgi:nitrite reductase/ring-hydroxylating ferredoxin subunit
MKRYTLGTNKAQVLNLIPHATIQLTKIGDKKVCITRKGESFFVFEELCPHRLASLAQGRINSKNEVICPLHEYRFDLETGNVMAGSCPNLKIYKNSLEDDGLHIFDDQL